MPITWIGAVKIVIDRAARSGSAAAEVGQIHANVKSIHKENANIKHRMTNCCGLWNENC
jgi:chromosome condensin MukBEF complex kleisin-like MukF subunit